MTPSFIVSAALWAALTITPHPTVASSQPQDMTVPQWKILVHAYSSAYGVNPYLSLALARAESEKGRSEFRFGRVGKYDLPYGVYVGCKVSRADTTGGNTEAGIRALARHLKKCGGNLRRALGRYNVDPRGFDSYYWKVLLWERRYRKAKVFG